MVGRAAQQLAWKAGAAWREWELKSRAARAWVEGREKQLGWLQRVFAAWVAGQRWGQGERWGSGQKEQIKLSGEWTRVRYAIIRRAGGARRREERERAADRAEQVGDAQARQAWEEGEALGYVVSHVTPGGRTFIDRLQVKREARRQKVGEAAHKRVVGEGAGELHVKRTNTDARALYGRIGYVESESEYGFVRQARAGQVQQYMAMRATATRDAPATTLRGGLRYVTIHGADGVPGEVWGWMRAEIRETDQVGQAWADRILGGEGADAADQTYTIVMRGEDRETGRGKRWVPLRTYKETGDRRRAGESTARACRMTVQLRVRHGWRLQQRLGAMVRDEHVEARRPQGAAGERDGEAGARAGRREGREQEGESRARRRRNEESDGENDRERQPRDGA
jgi:hypothetical protein